MLILFCRENNNPFQHDCSFCKLNNVSSCWGGSHKQSAQRYYTCNRVPLVDRFTCECLFEAPKNFPNHLVSVLNATALSVSWKRCFSFIRRAVRFSSVLSSDDIDSQARTKCLYLSGRIDRILETMTSSSYFLSKALSLCAIFWSLLTFDITSTFPS